MPEIKISELPSAVSISDVDTYALVQGGNTKKVLHSILKASIQSAIGPTIYTGSGELFNAGTATTREFLFKTSDNAIYNATGKRSEIRLNGYYNSVGGWSTSPGDLGFKAYKVGVNAYSWFNMFAEAAQVEMAAVDTTNARVRKAQVDSQKVLLVSDTPNGGPVFLEFRDTGAIFTDVRTGGNAKGLTYAADYSANMLSNDRSIPDVGTVKQLSNSIYTASGNVLNDGSATTRLFNFATDQDGTYNPTGRSLQMKFGGTWNNSGVFTADPGTIGFKTSKTGSTDIAYFNMYSGIPGIEMKTVNTGTNMLREFKMDSSGLYLTTKTTSNQLVSMSFNINGISMVDNRTPKEGIKYNADYSADLISSDRSIPDIGTVKKVHLTATLWTTVTRPTPVEGIWGYNTTLQKFEG